MSNILNKAYSAIQSLLSTELNSLANGSNVLSSAIDFSDATHARMTKLDVEVNLATANWSAQTNPAIYLWVLKRTDGTNYEDGGASIDPARIPEEIIPIRAVNGAQRVRGTIYLDTPEFGKILIGNRTGVAFNASGNTLKYYIHTNTIE
jgi:hypothetical protein